MTVFNLIKDAKKGAGKYASFWELDKPIFESAKHGVVEQWKIDQWHKIKPEGSFTLLAA